MTESAPTLRLLLVDDHEVLRLGLATLFGTVADFQVVGEAGSVSDAIARAETCHPDLVIMDVRLPDGSGVEACREIRSAHPDTKVIMLTSYTDRDAVVASIMAGAAGYMLKQTAPSRLIDAVHTVAAGGSLLDPGVTDTVLDWMRSGDAKAPDDPLAKLTEQEQKILPLIAEGRTNREIAGELFLSEHTIKTYISNILQKLNLNRRAEAAAFITRQQNQNPR